MRSHWALPIVLLCALSALGETKTWVGGDSELPRCWCKPGNWSPAGVPAETDGVVVGTSTNPPKLPYDVTCGSLTIQGGGQIDVGPHTLHVASLSSTIGAAGAGLLMTDANSEVIVDGNCYFHAGNDSPDADSTGNFTAGTIRARGEFRVTPGYHPGNSLSFVSTGTKVVFDGTTPQIVRIWPSEGQQHSRFADLHFANPAGVEYNDSGYENAPMLVTGALTSTPTAVVTGDNLAVDDTLPAVGPGYAVETTYFFGRRALAADAAIALPQSMLEFVAGAGIDLNGHTLALDCGVRLDSAAAGDGLVMTDPADVATVTGEFDYGDVGGAGQDGSGQNFSAGALHLRGDVNMKCTASAWLEHWLSRGTTVYLDGTAPQTLKRTYHPVNNPSLYWQDLVVSNPTTITLDTHHYPYVRGKLIVPTGADPTLVAGNCNAFWIVGADIDGLTLDGVRLTIGELTNEQYEPVIEQADGLRFVNIPTSSEYALRLESAGQAAPIIFRDAVFDYTPGADHDYFRTTTSTADDGVPLTVVFTNPTPADPGDFILPGDETTPWRIYWGDLPDNNPPAAPTLLSPVSGAVVSTSPFDMTFSGTDPDDVAALRYHVQINGAASRALAADINQVDGEGTWSKPAYGKGETATLTVDTALPSGEYTWRARAYDGSAWGDWSATGEFTAVSPLVVEEVALSPATDRFPTLTATITGENLADVETVELLLPSGAASSETVVAATEVAATATTVTAEIPIIDLLRRSTTAQVRLTTATGATVTVSTQQIRYADFTFDWTTPRTDGRLGVWDTYTLTVRNTGAQPETPYLELTLPIEVTEPDAYGAYTLQWEIVDSEGNTVASGAEPGADPIRTFLPPVGANSVGRYYLRVKILPAQGRTTISRGRVGALAPLIVVIGAAILYSYIGYQTVSASCEGAVVHALQTDCANEGMVLTDDQARFLFNEMKDHSSFLTRMLKLSAQGAAENTIKLAVGEYVGLKFPNADMETLSSELTGNILGAAQGEIGVDTILMSLLTNTSTALDWGTIPVKAAVGAFTGGGADCIETYKAIKKKLISKKVPYTYSWDPNAKGGSNGINGYIRGDEPISYTISFENDPEQASAAAQEVQLVDVLPAGLDLASLRFTTFSVGDQVITLPDGTTALAEEVDLGSGVTVQVTSALDAGTRRLTVLYRGVTTGTDDLAPGGFLPPNETAPEGEGWVTFEIDVAAGTASGTLISNTATITFDPHIGVNDPIETNAHELTLDNAAPAVALQSPPSTSAEPWFQLDWAGGDDASGIAAVELWARTDGGPYALFERVEPETAATTGAIWFRGGYDQTYAFYLMAEDVAGNRTSPPGGSQTVHTGPPPEMPAGLHLLSVPLAPGSADPRATFGDAADRWAMYAPGDAAYVRPPDTRADLALGRGYWSLFEAATVPTAHGVAADATGAYQIALEEGWNLIGTPWPADVPWDLGAIRVTSDAPVDDDCGCEPSETDGLTLAEAYAAGWIEDYAWAWLPDDTLTAGGRYTPVYDGALASGLVDRLEPWQGYWILAHADCTLILPGPGYDEPAATRATRARGWAFELRAATGDDAAAVTLGASSGGATRLLAPPAAPGGDDGLELAVLGSGRAAVDLAPLGRSRMEWSIEITLPPTNGRAASEVALTWPSLRAVPADFRLIVTDQATGTRRAMRTTSAYRFTPAAGETTRRFVISAERGTAALQVLGLRAVAGRSGNLEVAFELTDQAAVQMRLTSPTGRPLAQASGDSRAAGLQRLAVPARDAQGRPLPRGLYRIEVIAVDDLGRQARAQQVLLLQ